MEKCAACEKKSEYLVRHAGIGFCREHFAFYVEKKIKQAARELGIFEKDGKLGILLAGDAGSETARFVIGAIAGEMGVGITEIRMKKKKMTPKEIALLAKKKKIKLVVTGHCIEDFVLEMLVLASEKKPKKLLKLGPKDGIWGSVSGVSFPSPLFRLYRSEVEEYAKIKGLSFEKPESKIGLELALSGFVEKMEREHPGTKHKMLKSLLYFGNGA
jgi:hypothetical protein